MSADIIILPVVRVEQPKARTRPEPVARIRIGEHQRMTIDGFTAGEVCVPLVEMRCPSGELIHLTVLQAEEIAAGLTAAAAKART